jgi:acyl-CoA reductase-like NAD-dependent aldehyde dehydrogenase
LPITLVSGSGRELSPALVAAPEVGCVSFVGGRVAGSQVESLVDQGKRHILEQEGLNCWGVWEFSDWTMLAGHLRKSFDYAKQRCTAYPRYVVQRSLFDKFLAAYLPVLDEVRFGHPLAVEAPDDPLPELDFGPLINAAKVKELHNSVAETLDRGGVPVYRGDAGRGRFLDGQDRSAYLAPISILSPPSSSPLFHAEPFGPVDTIVLVDTEAELLAAMNASNGALVASIACDDEATAQRLGRQLQAFKVGINKPRSRGDRDEVFGGNGASWRGAFVGGELLVHAVTEGTGDDLHGNFPSYTRHPAS